MAQILLSKFLLSNKTPLTPFSSSALLGVRIKKMYGRIFARVIMEPKEGAVDGDHVCLMPFLSLPVVLFPLLTIRTEQTRLGAMKSLWN
jgi:hypothetical protein